VFVCDTPISNSFAKADEVDSSTPYYLFRDILEEIFTLTIEENPQHSPKPQREPIKKSKSGLNVPKNDILSHQNSNIFKSKGHLMIQKGLSSNCILIHPNLFLNTLFSISAEKILLRLF